MDERASAASQVTSGGPLRLSRLWFALGVACMLLLASIRLPQSSGEPGAASAATTAFDTARAPSFDAAHPTALANDEQLEHFRRGDPSPDAVWDFSAIESESESESEDEDGKFYALALAPPGELRPEPSTRRAARFDGQS